MCALDIKRPLYPDLTGFNGVINGAFVYNDLKRTKIYSLLLIWINLNLENWISLKNLFKRFVKAF